MIQLKIFNLNDWPVYVFLILVVSSPNEGACCVVAVWRKERSEADKEMLPHYSSLLPLENSIEQE